MNECLEIFLKLWPGLAVVVSALIAIWLGWNANRTQRDISRRRATLDTLLSLEMDRDYMECANVFRDIRDAHGLDVLSDSSSQIVKKSQIQFD